MTHRSTPKLKSQALSAEAVARYLVHNPDFFEYYPELLSSLKIPHPTRGAVSLIERQVAGLREKIRHLERKLVDLIHVARDNEGLSTRLHRLALGLMDAESVDDVLATTKDLLRSEFPSTHVVIRLLAHDIDNQPVTGLHYIAQGSDSVKLFDELFATQRPVCGGLSTSQLIELFGEYGPEVNSAVMIPLTDGRKLGVMALGSSEPKRFHDGMGTLFLGYLGELVSRAVKVHQST
jgi:uncharacterized protein YigA (DUF484 family)